MTDYEVVDLGNFPVDEATPVVSGPRGKSAYEVAVANGFVGTEAEWLASLGGGPGGGAVDSVNGQVGVVVLGAVDVGAETPAGSQTKVDTHAADTTSVHGIADTSALATTADVSAASTADRARANHTGTQSADTLTDGTTNKAFLATERTKLAGVATGATANDTDVNLKSRANHTGTQAASTITGLGTAATANTGTGATNVILGNDARLTDARTPTAHTHAASDVNSGTFAVARLGTGTPAAGKYVDGGTGAWTTLPSGGGSSAGAIIAYKELTVSAAYATTSTTDDNLDTTTPANCEVTFTVPASGNVMIRQEAYAQWAPTTSGGGFEWTLRDTSGTVVRTASISNTVTGLLRRVATYVITGLTPGASVTYRWGHHRAGASAGTTTVYTAGSGGVNGNAQMTVHTMP